VISVSIYLLIHTFLNFYLEIVQQERERKACDSKAAEKLAACYMIRITSKSSNNYCSKVWLSMAMSVTDNGDS